MLRNAGRDSGYRQSICGWLVEGATNTVAGVDRNGQIIAKAERKRQPLRDLELVVDVSAVIRNDRIGLRGERSFGGVLVTLMDNGWQAQQDLGKSIAADPLVRGEELGAVAAICARGRRAAESHVADIVEIFLCFAQIVKSQSQAVAPANPIHVV